MNDATHVIVGASLAGATAAMTLREEGATGRIILIGAEAELPYERPPLSKAYLRGEAPAEHTPLRQAAFYADHGIETVLGIRATKIDSNAKAVEVEDGRRISFDTALIATRVQNRHISIPRTDLEGIYGLRTGNLSANSRSVSYRITRSTGSGRINTT